MQTSTMMGWRGGDNGGDASSSTPAPSSSWRPSSQSDWACRTGNVRRRPWQELTVELDDTTWRLV